MKHLSLALWWGTAQTPCEPIQTGLRIAPIRCHPDKHRGFEKFLNFVLSSRTIQPISGDTWKRKWQPTPVFLPGKSHGQRRLAGYSPWSCKEMDTTSRLDNNGNRRHSRDQANWSVDSLESALGHIKGSRSDASIISNNAAASSASHECLALLLVFSYLWSLLSVSTLVLPSTYCTPVLMASLTQRRQAGHWEFWPLLVSCSTAPVSHPVLPLHLRGAEMTPPDAIPHFKGLII